MRSDGADFDVLELREHHRAEPDDWPARGREDAGLRPIRNPPPIQGLEEQNGGRTR